MERVTTAYKLGRKIQEHSAPDDAPLTPETADKFFSNYKRADEKLRQARAKSDDLRAEIVRLKTRVERLKNESSKSRGKLSGVLGRLIGKPKRKS